MKILNEHGAWAICLGTMWDKKKERQQRCKDIFTFVSTRVGGLDLWGEKTSKQRRKKVKW